MGWTGIHATHYRGGKINRKAEMDERWTQTEHDGYPELTVLKSSMVGSVYYAAIQIKRNGIIESVFATTALTSSNMREYFNFLYKDIDETAGPYDCKCPKGILDLLTPTDNEYANEWREKCRAKFKKKERN